MRILHLTDTHLFAEAGTLHYDRIDTDVALRAVLDRLTDLERIDLVVHTGDASDDGSVASYRRLYELLDPFVGRLGAPLAVAMGNHDVSAHHAEVAGEGESGPGYQDRVVEIPGKGRAVVLDTSVPGAGYGNLEAEQLSWLRQVLSDPAPGQAGTVLVMHHAPLAGPTRMMRSLELQNRDQLAEILSGSDVRIVLAGHYHTAVSGSFAGIPVHVAPGITNVVDPLTAGDSERALALSGANLVEFADGGAGAGERAATGGGAVGDAAGAGAGAAGGAGEDVAGAAGGAGEDAVGAAPRVSSSIWPNVGDAAADITCPVYEFGPEIIDRIAAEAGPAQGR